MTLEEINPKDLTENAIKLIGLEWMLIAAGNVEKYNMMTASWGGLGVLWHKPVCFVFVRPSRYTYDFVEEHDNFSLTFFTKEHKPKLNFCGSKSGRDVNKMTEVDLTPESLYETVFFKEARIILFCKKLYYHDLTKDNFIHDIADSFYKNGNYHRMYVAEIIGCYVEKED